MHFYEDEIKRCCVVTQLLITDIVEQNFTTIASQRFNLRSQVTLLLEVGKLLLDIFGHNHYGLK